MVLHLMRTTGGTKLGPATTHTSLLVVCCWLTFPGIGFSQPVSGGRRDAATPAALARVGPDLARPLVARTKTVLDDAFLKLTREPLNLALTVGLAYLFIRELGASSLGIEVMAWFRAQARSELQLIHQEALLGFMEVVGGAERSFAFPTRTIPLVSGTSTEPQRPKPSY